MFESDFDQLERNVFDPTSDLYRFSADFVIVFQSVQKLYDQFLKLNNIERTGFAESTLSGIDEIYRKLTSQRACNVIYLNFPEFGDVFGNFCNKVEMSFTFQLRKINLGLMNLAFKSKNLFIADLCAIQARYGNSIFDPRLAASSDLIFSLDFLPVLARNITSIIQSLTGKSRKCLILDLDNILWGGSIGEDGLEKIQIGQLGIGKAFTKFQYWIKELKNRGIILAVCSKNDQNTAREPFEKHTEMILRLEDFAVFSSNWENKADNIRSIQKILNIGFDSMVFLDDSRFEREQVRISIPEITIPELPEDPALFLDFLMELNLFETSSFDPEDLLRTRRYQEQAGRRVLEINYRKEEDFLESLEMTCGVSSFNDFSIPRVAQLVQRSNQFNLRTVRYNEEQLGRIAASPDFFTFSFNLKDKFGDYGISSAMILRKDGRSLFIDTWVMSCRVIKRSLECFALNALVKPAIDQGFEKLMGEYIPTAKNSILADHYSRLGFSQQGNLWYLNLAEFQSLKTFIKAESL
ncbi:MAG: HAD-IIIC family phosphatase [Candidatus Wallbacteria bacterium]|nr:HAD-IIIC family phosphatase [Candidatus Wallbacteria bacterium]